MSRTTATNAEPAAESIAAHRPAAAGDLLTFGFGAAVAMWFVGYLTHMPGLVTPGPVTAGLLAACPFVAGLMLGHKTRRSWGGGAIAGLIAGAINLLILGSLLSGDEAAQRNAAVWASAMLAATAAATALGTVIGSFTRHDRHSTAQGPSLNAKSWTGSFAVVTLCATGVLLLSGGLVTAREAGLAVKDWPTSFGHNMWLYPLAKMTGNIYYEHTHRLYGTLVGLATIALTVHLLIADRRRWLKAVAVIAFVAVCAQGVMGGLRVTEADTPVAGVEVAEAVHETTASALLRVTHGVFAQVFFALIAAIAVFTSKAWTRIAGPTPHPAASMDRTLSIALVALLLVQLVLGARVRHLHDSAVVHIILASVVLVAGFAVGMRSWGLHGEAHPPLRRLGIAVVATVTLQLLLGFAAFAAKGISANSPVPTTLDIVATTAHQFNGALLLAAAVAACLLIHRRLTPPTLATTTHPNTEPPNAMTDDARPTAPPPESVTLALADVPDGEARQVKLAGESVCVARVDGQVYAVSDRCTHANVPLSDGGLIGRQIVCPWHGAMFDLATGRATCGPATHPLRCYAVTVEGDRVTVSAAADGS